VLKFRPSLPAGEANRSCLWAFEARPDNLPFNTAIRDCHDSSAGEWATDFRSPFPDLTDFGFCFSSHCWHVCFLSIAVGIGCVCVTLDSFINLMSMHRHISRGCNAEANFAVSDLNHHDADVVTDHDFLIYGSG
jgi:hypothetical protein